MSFLEENLITPHQSQFSEGLSTSFNNDISSRQQSTFLASRFDKENQGVSVSIDEIPRAQFTDFDGKEVPSPLDGGTIQNPAQLYQVIANLGYQSLNDNKLSAINIVDVSIQRADEGATSGKLVTLAGTEFFQDLQDNNGDNYLKGLVDLQTSYTQTLDDALRSLPAGSHVVLAGHSAGGIALLGGQGEQLIEKAEREYGLEIELVATFGAPYVGSNDTLFPLRLNTRTTDDFLSPNNLKSTDTDFVRFAAQGDAVAWVTPGNIAANVLGATTQPERRNYNNWFDAHSDAYADASAGGFGGLDLLGSRDHDQSINLTITGDTVVSYAVSESSNDAVIKPQSLAVDAEAVKQTQQPPSLYQLKHAIEDLAESDLSHIAIFRANGSLNDDRVTALAKWMLVQRTGENPLTRSEYNATYFTAVESPDPLTRDLLRITLENVLSDQLNYPVLQERILDFTAKKQQNGELRELLSFSQLKTMEAWIKSDFILPDTIESLKPEMSKQDVVTNINAVKRLFSSPSRHDLMSAFYHLTLPAEIEDNIFQGALAKISQESSPALALSIQDKNILEAFYKNPTIIDKFSVAEDLFNSALDKLINAGLTTGKDDFIAYIQERMSPDSPRFSDKYFSDRDRIFLREREAERLPSEPTSHISHSKQDIENFLSDHNVDFSSHHVSALNGYVFFGLSETAADVAGMSYADYQNSITDIVNQISRGRFSDFQREINTEFN